MIEQDTIKLLRECDAGVKMGVASIDDVLDRVHSEKLRQRLITCKAEHEKLKGEINGLLGEYHDEGKEPNPVAKGMSWMKVGVKMGLDDSDKTVADLMTDGCNMGRTVHESVGTQLRLRLMRGGETVVEHTDECAGFEYSGGD